jgi:hypothetical protein
MALMLAAELKLVDLIGEDAALKLVEEFGGRRLDIPRSVGPRHQLAKVIGEAAARKLVAEYFGGRLRVPMAKFWRAQVYRARGLSYNEIAKRLQVTDNSVHRFLRDAGVVRKLRRVRPKARP